MTVQWLPVGMSFIINVLLAWCLYKSKANNIWLITLIGLACGVLWLPQSLSMNIFLALFYVLAICLYSALNRIGFALLTVVFVITLSLLFNGLISERWIWVGLSLTAFVMLVVLLIQGRASILPAWFTVLLLAATLLLMPTWSDNILIAATIVTLQLYLLLKVLLFTDNSQQSASPFNVAEIQAAERSRIYQNIHDDVGAELLRLIYLLDDNAQKKQVKDIMQRLRRAVAQTTQMATDVQQLSDDMIELCRQRMAEANIECRCEAVIAYNYVFNNTHPTGLLRIMNELLTNITRHSQAQKVSLQINSDERGLKISLRDNGCGLMPENNTVRLGRGIRGLRKRAAEMGADIDWQNNKDKGLTTDLSYSWPS